MAQEQQHFKTLLFHDCTAGQLPSQRNDTCTRIQNEDVFTSTDLHTGSVTTVLQRAVSRRWIAPAHAPEFYFQFSIHDPPPYNITRFHLHSYYRPYTVFLKESFP